MDADDREALESALVEAKHEQLEDMDADELMEECSESAAARIQDAMEDARHQREREYGRQVGSMDEEELLEAANELGVRRP
jgi:hypothetical protein